PGKVERSTVSGKCWSSRCSVPGAKASVRLPRTERLRSRPRCESVCQRRGGLALDEDEVAALGRGQYPGRVTHPLMGGSPFRFGGAARRPSESDAVRYLVRCPMNSSQP